MSELPVVELMSRKGCCLCEDAEVVVRQLEGEALCRVRITDVDHELALAARYGADVPVLLIDGVERMKHRIGVDELRALLLIQED